MPDSPKPRPAELDLRASDAEREQVIDLLRRHAGEGRITADELSERIDAVYAARTVGELRGPLADLPAEAPRPPLPSARRRARPRASLPAPLPLLGVVAVVLVATLTGAWWLLWGLWPLLALSSGGGWGCHPRAVTTPEQFPRPRGR